MTPTRPFVRFLVIAVAASLILAACTNDPFDPTTVTNQNPVIRFFAEPVDPDDELNPTSYFDRTFHWSGTDQDGQVEEYYVSIRLFADVPAPWDTTTRTDTTMTFQTDDDGNAEATFYLVCRDNQGAFSDTLVQYVPLRNFPPAMNFQSDFNPLKNLQRDFIVEGETVVDTVYWNWGAMNLRLFAFDPDGRETMDDHYRYTCAETEPTEVRDWDDPDADVMQHWLQAPFVGSDEIREFEIFVSGVPAGERTIIVAVGDEADAETRLTYTWDVRDPRSGVMLVPDNSSTTTRQFYREFATDYLGEGNWDEYDFWFGFPDNLNVLIESFRRFDLVFWFDGGATSEVLQEAAARDGALETYLYPADEAEPGRLLLISGNLTGASSDIPYYFRQAVLGVSPTGAPESPLEPIDYAFGAPVLGAQTWLPTMTLANLNSRGIGLSPVPGTEELYRFEECKDPDDPDDPWDDDGCFGLRPPYDPLIGVRRPQRSIQDLATVVGVSYHFEHMNYDEAMAALAAIFEFELGVSRP